MSCLNETMAVIEFYLPQLTLIQRCSVCDYWNYADWGRFVVKTDLEDSVRAMVPMRRITGRTLIGIDPCFVLATV